jgi:hypothetical protein
VEKYNFYRNFIIRVTSMYIVDMDTLFLIKILMKKSPYVVILASLFISIAYFGFALRISESVVYREEINTLKDYENSFWCIIIT